MTTTTGFDPPCHATSLQRHVGLGGAILLGLGSILGTGVFVSLAIGTGIAGQWIILAVGVAGLVALANGMSSAQLAANHPVSGGTYEYGYRWLSPQLGFAAGFLFLCAKSASAATAARGFAGYFVAALNWNASDTAQHAIALATILILTVLTWAGMKRSNRANSLIVGLTIGVLLAFIAAGMMHSGPGLASQVDGTTATESIHTTSSRPWQNLLEASALMFVAYTGYGRIATLGEEVIAPQRTIPRAILWTLAISFGLYAGVAWVAIQTVGAKQFAVSAETSAAPLELVARQLAPRWLPTVMSLGAMTAMLGVLLNLILGLSRVLFAMGRRGDMPARFGTVDASGHSPTAAILGVSAFVALLSLIGPLKLTWSFSAFTVLVYYAITNLAAIRLSNEERLYPRWIAVFGFLACLTLAPWVEKPAWLAGIALLLLGLVWQRHGTAWMSGRVAATPKQ